eukprot:scaffold120873_cov29-Tisochrysis_lutea.AAC.3
MHARPIFVEILLRGNDHFVTVRGGRGAGTGRHRAVGEAAQFWNAHRIAEVIGQPSTHRSTPTRAPRATRLEQRKCSLSGSATAAAYKRAASDLVGGLER